MTESQKIEALFRQQGVVTADKEWEHFSESFHDAMDELRKSNPTLDAVKKRMYELRGAIIEVRKQKKISELATTALITKYQAELNHLMQLKRMYEDNARAQRDLAKAADDAAKAQAKAAEEAARAQDKQAHSLGRLIKQGILWAVGSASMYYVWRKIRTSIINTTKALYENTKEYKALAAAMNDYRQVSVQVITTAIQLPVLMDSLAKRLATLTQMQALWGANIQMTMGTVGEFIRQLRKGEEVDVYKALTAGADAAKASLLKSVELMNSADDAAKDYSSQISSLVSRMRTFNEAAAEQAAAIREIKQAFSDASAVARGEYASSLMQIEIDLNKAISVINAEALESRASAYAKYQDKLTDLQREGSKKREQDAERHALEMEFAQRKHNLSLIQNERMYQYSRGLLVAEGDVLAIEDLDARYQLERQAAEENFALQQQQAEALYRLQARIQEESTRNQVAALQSALRDELVQIEEGRREKIEEAKATAQEQEAVAADAQATALAAAMQAKADDLKVQEEGQAEREKSLVDFLVDMGQDMGIGLESVQSIAEQYFDVGGSFDALMQDAWTRQATYMKVFTDEINTAISRLYVLEAMWSIGGHGGGFGGGGSRGGSGYVPPERTDLYAHGTDTIVSSPTNFTAGERGAERVIVQPLSPIGVGGNVSMSWHGGPIPIHGTGAMDNIDTSAIGNAIAQGLVQEMARSFSSIRGTRGR